jgi:hypothetical protein
MKRILLAIAATLALQASAHADGLQTPHGVAPAPVLTADAVAGDNFTDGAYDELVDHIDDSRYVSVDVLPVPEPSTWVMLLAGCGLVLLAGRRQSAAFSN